MLQEKDNGRWRCNVGVVDNSEVTTASGMANISIAVAPEEIFIAQPFDTPTANLSAGEAVEKRLRIIKSVVFVSVLRIRIQRSVCFWASWIRIRVR
jgi:hypothetical protein